MGSGSTVRAGGAPTSRPGILEPQEGDFRHAPGLLGSGSGIHGPGHHHPLRRVVRLDFGEGVFVEVYLARDLSLPLGLANQQVPVVSRHLLHALGARDGHVHRLGWTVRSWKFQN